MTSTPGTLQRLFDTIRDWGSSLVSFVRSSLRRLRTRWVQDTTFRRTVSMAINAITVTALDSPSLGVAVDALLSERIRRSHVPFAYDDEDDYDTFPRPPRLWDTLN